MSNIASPNQLNMLDDASLTKYAAAQKAAGNMANFSLAFQISNDRSRMRQQAAAQAMGGAKPPVADSDLQQMAVNANQVPNMPTGIPQAGAGSVGQAPEIQNAAKGGMLPENQGIGKLRAKNLEAFAEGGITGYDGGGATYSPDVYRRYAIQKAQQMGLPPSFADSIFHIESGYNPNAIPRDKNGKVLSSAVGIGQLKPSIASAYGITPEERKDGFKNIDASLNFMKDLQGKYGGDTQKMAVAYNQGEKFLNDHLKANNGQLVPDKLNKPEATNYLKKLGDLLPISSAQAAEVVPGRTPAPVATPTPTAAPVQSGDSASSAMIPGQGPSANTQVGGTPITGNQGVIGAGETALQYGTGLLSVPTSGLYGLYRKTFYGEDPNEAAARAQNAVTYSPRTEGGKAVSQAFGQKLEDLKIPPYLAHIGLGETVRAPETSVEGTAQAMQDAIARGQRKADLPRLEAPATPGEPIVVDSSGNAMTASRRTNMQNALNDEAGMPANAGEVADWQKANATARQLEANKEISAENRGEANRAQATATALGVAPQNAPLPGAADTTAPAPVDYDKLWGPGATVGDVNNYTGPDNAPSTSDIGKNVTDTSGKGGRDWNDFLLNLGLGLMAGKSPYALQNLGEAGIGALRQEQEAKKQALQERQAASLEALQKQQGAYATAQAGYLESLKGPQAALELAEKRYDAWSKSPAGVQMTVNDPAKANQMYKEFVQGSYKDLGIIHPSMMSPETAGFMSKYGVQ